MGRHTRRGAETAGAEATIARTYAESLLSDYCYFIGMASIDARGLESGSTLGRCISSVIVFIFF
jgi:hypothetical protein